MEVTVIRTYNGDISIYDSDFRNITCNFLDGLGLTVFSSVLKIQRSNFTNISANNGFGAAIYSSSLVGT